MDVEAEVHVTGTGDPGFEDCFRAQFPVVARTAALVVGDFGVGEEIAQEAFARLFVRWQRVESPEHARNFVFKVAMNLARSHLRRRQRRVFQDSPGADEAPDHSGGTDSRLAIREALAGLSPRQRASVALVDYVGLDAETASRLLGLRASTVRVHLARGRRALGERLDPEDLRR